MQERDPVDALVETVRAALPHRHAWGTPEGNLQAAGDAALDALAARLEELEAALRAYDKVFERWESYPEGIKLSPASYSQFRSIARAALRAEDTPDA